MDKHSSEILNIVIVGAHPDDCEFMAGGITARYIEMGHNVTYIVTTNGDAGHHEMDRQTLKKRRKKEACKVSECLGVQYEIMDVHDCHLEPTLKNRETLIRLLRKYQPDLIITHTFEDYHADHRYTAQLVADTAYILNVPLCVPEAPVIRKGVVFCQMSEKPHENIPVSILVPIDGYMDKKRLAFHLNDSQVYEWLPWVDNINLSDIPSEQNDRLEFLRHHWDPRWQEVANNYRMKLDSDLGSDASSHINYIEAIEALPWGLQLTEENVGKYFPFADSIILT